MRPTLGSTAQVRSRTAPPTNLHHLKKLKEEWDNIGPWIGVFNAQEVTRDMNCRSLPTTWILRIFLLRKTFTVFFIFSSYAFFILFSKKIQTVCSNLQLRTQRNRSFIITRDFDFATYFEVILHFRVNIIFKMLWKIFLDAFGIQPDVDTRISIFGSCSVIFNLSSFRDHLGAIARLWRTVFRIIEDEPQIEDFNKLYKREESVRWLVTNLSIWGTVFSVSLFLDCVLIPNNTEKPASHRSMERTKDGGWLCLQLWSTKQP